LLKYFSLKRFQSHSGPLPNHSKAYLKFEGGCDKGTCDGDVLLKHFDEVKNHSTRINGIWGNITLVWIIEQTTAMVMFLTSSVRSTKIVSSLVTDQEHLWVFRDGTCPHGGDDEDHTMLQRVAVEERK